MDRTTRSRLVAAGTVSVAGLLFIGACGGSGGGGSAASTSVVDSTAFRTIPVTAPPTTPAPVPAETTPAGGAAAGSGTDTSGSGTAQQGGVQGNVYIVESGDYFFGIAKKLGVSAETLAAYNDMTLQSNLVPGMTLRIPPDSAGGSQSSGGSTAGSGGGSPTTQAPADGSYYIAVANDFWPAIAAKLGVDLDALLKANGATMQTTVYVGQRIKIPS